MVMRWLKAGQVSGMTLGANSRGSLPFVSPRADRRVSLTRCTCPADGLEQALLDFTLATVCA